MSELSDAIEDAKNDLPDGYTISIEVEKDGCVVCLNNKTLYRKKGLSKRRINSGSDIVDNIYRATYEANKDLMS